ncbi:lipoprotein [Hydrogenophaga sp.]|uniref:LPS translocon maturation chaperone LptM n=1 Tax=Hydrogenophaga sp. TaxID=1904254 RepID=UPI0034477D31
MLRTTRILGRHLSRTRVVAIGLGLLLLSACGQKGALYLPAPETAPSSVRSPPDMPPPQDTPPVR